MDNLPDESNEHKTDELANQTHNQLTNDGSRKSQIDNVQVTSNAVSTMLSETEERVTDLPTSNDKKNYNTTKPVPFRIRLSYSLGHLNKSTSAKCFYANEPKKFIFCRWSQMFLMLLVVAYYSHTTSQIVFSYNPPQNVPPLNKCEDMYLGNGEEPGNKCALNETIVNKCCPTNYAFTKTNNLTCSFHNYLATEFKLFNGNVFFKLKHGQTLKDLKLTKDNDILTTNAEFNKSSRHKLLEEETYLMEGGVVLMQNLIYLHPDDFCAEIILESNRTVVMRYMKGPFKYIVGDAKDNLIWYCLAPISTAALLIVLGVYILRPQLQNLHGKMLISHLLCQIGFFVTTTFHKFPAQDSFLCYFFNYTLEFSILAKHCWMTAMSYDLWYSFSRPLRRPRNPKSNTFLLYSVCCWGCAGLLCVSTAAVGVVPHVTDSCPRPRFEDDACFFSRRRTADLFINTPMALALFLNLVMFLSTIVNLRCLHVGKVLTQDRAHNQAATEGLLLYIKLALIMGINWFLVWVGFQVETLHLYLYIRAVISTQGVVLAVILMCNKRVWNIIHSMFANVLCQK